jgi:hypothetical protein
MERRRRTITIRSVSMVIATLFRGAITAAHRFAQRRIRRKLPAACGTSFGAGPIEDGTFCARRLEEVFKRLSKTS